MDRLRLGPWRGLPSLPWPVLSDINYVMTSSVSNIGKKIGRPAVNAVPVTVRIPPEQLARLDEWIAVQGDAPSRPEAIRRIIEKVL